MSILATGQKVSGYTVQSVIKVNEYTETYRVIDDKDDVYFMKVYALKRTPERLINPETQEVFAIERCRALNHENIVQYITSGKVNADGGDCHFMVTKYFTGDVLSDYIGRKKRLDQTEALRIYEGVLNGLKYLHEQNLCHNDIAPSNIMLNSSLADTPEIIDMGHLAPPCTGGVKIPFEVSDLEILYCANETLMGMYDQQSDIFAVTAVFYTMLTGKAPWEMEFNAAMSRARKFTLLKEKRRNEQLDLSEINIDDYLKDILKHGLAVSYDKRYQSVDEVLYALQNKKDHVGTISDRNDNSRQQHVQQSQSDPADVVFDIKSEKGNGFKDIAGMQALKDLLFQKVIFVITNKDKAEKYKITPPNGMLLYGPPGCGKTFFAEKFAEETGFNFMMVKSSDLASVYVHGAQEKIGNLFKQAEKKKPTVLCFDEFDALVPNRSSVDNQSISSEVNEFLSQLNNCSKRGIFVIATSNRPDKIDPAVLRTGRIDKQVYVPLPDFDARREMFCIHLNGRPYEGVDVDVLAQKTDGYIASDIAYIVNDSAMVAAFTDKPITQDILLTSLNNTKPSLNKELLGMYDVMRAKIERGERENAVRRPIGFR